MACHKAGASLDDGAMGKTWRLMSGRREVMAMPRAAFARAVMLNHRYHHRGQFLVYLRLLSLPVPSVYGQTGTRTRSCDRIRAAHDVESNTP
jgi:hypothetical protein